MTDSATDVSVGTCQEKLASRHQVEDQRTALKVVPTGRKLEELRYALERNCLIGV